MSEHEHDGHAHHEESFLRKYIFSVDHKVIGIQYGLTSLLFLFIGFSLMMLMRWQLAYPGEALPLLGSLFSDSTMPDGVMQPEFYNQLGAMHGTIMVFLGIVPLAVGAFGNYVVPLQIGAPDMAFPKLNMASYWVFFVGGVIMLSSFWVPGGAAKAGWTSYPPLSDIETMGQTIWLIGMIFLITSSLLGAVNFLTTIIQLRAPGMTLWRMPFFVWTQLITSFLLLLAFPPLEAAGVLQLFDRLVGTSFFLPSGLVVSGELMDVAGGGSPLLWQHLFWFLAHPEVYVLILPAMGIVAEIVANNTRKPLWGYRVMVYSLIFLGFMSFIVWAHHMFITGMGTALSGFFQVTTMIISVPSVIILSALFLSLWGASLRFTTPMLFALAFLPMFGIGGLTGLPLGLAPTDIPLHDTMYVIGHFHYVVAPGTILAMFAGIYYWYPKATGRMLNEPLGKIHFWVWPASPDACTMAAPATSLRRKSSTTMRPCRLRRGSWVSSSCRSSSTSSGASGRARRWRTTIRGTPPRSSGRPPPPHRWDMAISRPYRQFTAAPTSTAYPATTVISTLRTSLKPCRFLTR
jgi:cytochrome c oxidase subunit 1